MREWTVTRRFWIGFAAVCVATAAVGGLVVNEARGAREDAQQLAAALDSGPALDRSGPDVTEWLGTLQARQADLTERNDRLVAISTRAFLLVFGVLLVGAWLAHRRLIRPVGALAKAAAEIGETGRFSLSPERQDHGDIAVLVESFRSMAESVEQLESNAMESALCLSECFEALRRMEDGDPTARVSEEYKDELMSNLAVAVNRAAAGVGQLVDNAHEMAVGLCESFEVLRRLAEGDLTAKASETSTDELLSRLAAMINAVTKNLRALAMGNRESAEQVAASSSQILAAAEQQAAAVAEQAAQVSQTAASAKELAASAKQITQLAEQIAESAGSSVELAKDSSEAVADVGSGMERIRASVEETARRIEGLGERSQAITEIVTLIEDIADQTNLLSLNASIEAARAGEAGKGFAVVAGAIGELAERTAKSTKEISELIVAIQKETSSCVMSMEQSTAETQRGAALSGEASEKLRKMVAASQEVAESAREIALSSQQQTSASEEISQAMASVDDIMKQSAGAAQQTAASAKQLAELAANLRAGVSRLKLDEGEVLAEPVGIEAAPATV